MARKKTTKAPEDKTAVADEIAIQTAANAFDENNNRLTEIDTKFSDGLPYDVSRIKNETIFYLNQSAGSMLEAGKRLILLKEHELHGSFTKHLEDIGIAPRAARKMMQAAVKFSGDKAALVQLGKGKMLELLSEDDAELSELAKGGTIAGLELDEIESMSSTELRKALRKSRKNEEDSEEVNNRLLDQKDKKINQLHKKLHDKKKKTESWDERVTEFNIEATVIAAELLGAVDRMDTLRDMFLTEDFGEEKEAATEMMAIVYYDAINQIVGKIGELRSDCEDVFSGYKDIAKPMLN